MPKNPQPASGMGRPMPPSRPPPPPRPKNPSARLKTFDTVARSKHPALQDAYEKYLVVRGMVCTPEEDEDAVAEKYRKMRENSIRSGMPSKLLAPNLFDKLRRLF